MSGQPVHGYKWVHPVCGHETGLSSNPRHDLFVPDDMLRSINLPKPSNEHPDMFEHYAHPSNHKFMAEFNPNPNVPLPTLQEFEQSSPGMWNYGAFEVKMDPNMLPMGVTHPSHNKGKNLDPMVAIANGMKYGHEREPPPGAEDEVDVEPFETAFSLGWPSIHVDCPTCTLQAAQVEFDRKNVEMIEAAQKGEDWQEKSRELSGLLMKIERLKRPNPLLPLTTEPKPHPDDPPILRGPGAQHYRQTSGDFDASAFDSNGATLLASPDQSVIGSPPLAALPGSGMIPPPDIGSPSSHPAQGFTRRGRRHRSATRISGDYTTRPRGNTFDNNIAPRRRGYTADGTSFDPQYYIQQALANVSLDTESQAASEECDQMQMSQPTSSVPVPGPGPGSRPHARHGQGHSAGRGRSMSASFSAGRNRANSNVGRPHSSSSPAFVDFGNTANPVAPIPEDEAVGTFAPVAPTADFNAPSAPSRDRQSRAIPIVDPSTGQPTEPTIQADVSAAPAGHSQPANKDDWVQSTAPAKNLAINTVKANNFASENRFGVLDADSPSEGTDSPSTPGGVPI